MFQYGASAHIGYRIHTYSLPVLLAAGAACLLLEAWLAHREKRWPGLVLPGLAFLWALANAVLVLISDWERVSGAVGFALIFFLWDNVRTLALLTVYAACREHRRRRLRRMEAQMDRMNINDL